MIAKKEEMKHSIDTMKKELIYDPPKTQGRIVNMFRESTEAN